MRRLDELSFQRMPVTLIVAALVVALEALFLFDPERRDLYYNDLKLGIWYQIWMGEWWRPFTSALLHGNLVHLAFNLAWWLTFAPVVEIRLGLFRMLGLLALLAYVPMLAQFLVSNYHELGHGALGLSGVVYGLFGFLWAGRRRHADFADAVPPQVAQTMVGWFVACVVLTWFQLLPVANTAHGLGVLLGWLVGQAAYATPARRPLWGAAALLVAGGVLATLAGLPGHAGYELARALHVGN